MSLLLNTEDSTMFYTTRHLLKLFDQGFGLTQDRGGLFWAERGRERYRIYRNAAFFWLREQAK